MSKGIKILFIYILKLIILISEPKYFKYNLFSMLVVFFSVYGIGVASLIWRVNCERRAEAAVEPN